MSNSYFISFITVEFGNALDTENECTQFHKFNPSLSPLDYHSSSGSDLPPPTLPPAVVSFSAGSIQSFESNACCQTDSFDNHCQRCFPLIYGLIGRCCLIELVLVLNLREATSLESSSS